ncbi:uncharacterized protein [Acropora muricata]
MEDGRVRDSQISSNHGGQMVFKARLNYYDGGWCSESIKSVFLQIALKNVRHVSGIATQGVLDSSFEGYVKTFRVEYSYDGTKWYTYKDSGGSVETFDGNHDTFSVKNNYFRDTFVTKVLRIYPKTFKNQICMRVELYGCNDPSDDCSSYIKTASGSIDSLSFPGSYPGNKDCTWLIEVSKDKNIALMFTQFDVYQGSNPGGCKDDYVEVRDGLTDSSPVIGGKYCNQNRTMLIITNKNVARIYFHTGIANHDHKGFRLYFLAVTKGSDDVLSGTGCDGEVLALDCSGYQNTINILHARYQIGSFPFSCGQRHNYSSSKSCPAFDAMGEIVSKCQDYKKCHITVNESSFPGQSCARVRRQLEAFYRCNSTNTKTPAPTLQPLFSHSVSTSHVTESTTEAKVTETSPVTKPNSTPRSTGTNTEVTSNRTDERKEDQIADWGTTGIVLFVLAVLAVTIIRMFLLPLFWRQIKKVWLISGNLKLKWGDSIARV